MLKAVSVDRLTKQYGKNLAVDSISFDVKKGEIVGFVGKNGAGKTTVIRAVLNMIFPTEGSITVNGLDAVKDSKKIKEFLGYTSSDSEFYGNFKVKELFKFCAGFANNGVKSALERADELADYFELNLNKRIRELSLGNRKKVSIIQALMKRSEIIVLDEPTNGLDPLMQERFFKLIQKERDGGAAVFLSSHNLREIEKYCDRVIIIKDGRIVEFVDVKEVSKSLGQRVAYTLSNGESFQFNYNGSINELLLKLSKLDIEKLEISQRSIEEEFIKYYKDGADCE